MATSGYSEDLQPQQANTVTIATPAATTPSSTKTAHFLSEIPAASGTIVSANQATSAASKPRQDALCSQTPGSQTQSQKAVVLTTPTQHYVTPDIQHSAAQKSNGQSSSPQYIIVTVTGEGPVTPPAKLSLCIYQHTNTHTHRATSVIARVFWQMKISCQQIAFNVVLAFIGLNGQYSKKKQNCLKYRKILHVDGNKIDCDVQPPVLSF